MFNYIPDHSQQTCCPSYLAKLLEKANQILVRIRLAIVNI